MTANSQQKYSIKNGAQLRSLKLDFPSRCFSKPLTTERKYDLDMRGYESTRHTVNSSLVNSSHTRLITQSTRHKRAHNKTTSTSRNYLHAVRRHPETVLMLNNDGVITAICVTLMYTADYRSQQQITLIQKARSTRHNAEKHDGQLVTRFYGVTSWLVPIWDFHSFPWSEATSQHSAATNTCYVSYYFACRETHVQAITDVLWYVEVEKILCNAWMTVKKPA